MLLSKYLQTNGLLLQAHNMLSATIQGFNATVIVLKRLKYLHKTLTIWSIRDWRRMKIKFQCNYQLHAPDNGNNHLDRDQKMKPTLMKQKVQRNNSKSHIQYPQ
jgi:hypothetical protein